MRILQVFDFLSLPHGGGTVDIVHRLSQALSDRGHDVTICTGDFELDQPYIDQLYSVNVKVYSSWFNTFGMYVMPGIFKLDVRDYDVIHLHCLRSYQNAVICSKSLKHNVPYIIDAHGSTVELSGKKQIIREIYDRVFGNTILKNASRIIAETDIGITEYEKLGADISRSVILHPLIDASEYDSLPDAGTFRRKYNIREKYLVLFVGRIHWAKGIETLIDATRNMNDVCLVIVGQDDGYRTTLERMPRGTILFTGFLGGRDKLSAIVDADILVQPSKNEAGARPSLESILCDTPVIVTENTGAGKEIVKMDAGYLFEYGNVGQLSCAIKYIIDNYDKAQEKTQRAKRYIQDNLSLNNQIVKYEELYKGVMA